MSRMVLVDDDASINMLVTLVLRQSGHIVRQAYNGLEALRLIKIELPDIIITDLNMPRMTGLELIAAVSKEWSHIPIVVFSVHLDAARLSLSGTGSQIYYLTKPFDRQQLINVLTKALSPIVE